MAIKSQTTLLRVSTAVVAADNITAITQASPPVVTCGTHGIANGAIIVISGVLGMTQLNGRAFVTANVAGTTLELKGIDATGYTAYVSGGTVVEQTMTEVSEVKSVAGFNGTAPEIDTTHLRSTAKEYLIGLQDFGTVDLNLSLITDTGQTRLRALKSSGASAATSITLSDGRIAAFIAFVQSLSFDAITPDGSVTGSSTLRVTGEPSWFA